jgi:hypothetical protein
MRNGTSAKRFTNTNGTTNHTKSTSKDFKRQLGELAHRWESHDGNDLALRHETGVLLNTFYGDPTQRQARGKGVMKQAAKQLRKTEAELSQLRWFARSFPSLKVLKRRFPDVTNWTQVRDLLVKLRQRNRKGKPSARRASTKPISAVTHPLRQLTSAIRKLGDGLSAKDRGRLVQQLKEFVKAVPKGLHIRLVIQKA